ncbi:acyl transferase, partial [Flavobacteriaceae bacterium]|nr:acyl transferase [Flavobacteriaceae bacterium]
MRSTLTAFDKIKSPSEFEERALVLFQYQYENNPVYRSYCDLINVSPSEVNQLSNIPYLPIQFFKSHKVSCN